MKYFKEVLITEEKLKTRALEIGKLIDEKYGEEPIMIIGLLKGAYVFTSDVARSVKNPNLEVEFMVAKSYSNGSSTGEVQIILDLKKEVKNKNVILVEDIVDTGRTLSKVKDLMLFRGAKKVEIAVMCTKPSRREISVEIDYPSFVIPNEIVVGYGLDYNEKFRHLPYVASITKETFEKFKI
ncbi:hypoxanthine phosphoribosyltransferase [Mycoplasma marinum]|uniref:Hypoxanthine phosphoribosyltransferase n=1 Tax=Mycoplasma marinum TaxID=1937190 RepID=A0A4R0XKS4_9MOLU|nr:hypoxanthine phosphoribosyltransferase [Mycoplasma marinum]TCG11243.1 hypoxanthine phosphoribosyltransferase [Mycoplasma marinum]